MFGLDPTLKGEDHMVVVAWVEDKWVEAMVAVEAIVIVADMATVVALAAAMAEETDTARMEVRDYASLLACLHS